MAGAVRRAGHPTRVIDLMFSDNPQEVLERALSEYRPDLVGVSIRNIDNQNMADPVFFADDLKPLFRTIRRAESDPWLVIGGAGFSLFPVQLLRDLDADYGVVGDGEELFPQMVSCLAAGTDPVVLGPSVVSCRSRGQTEVIPATSSCFAVHLPDLDGFEVSRYHETPGTDGIPGAIPVEVSRGCSRHCIYCTTPLTEGRSQRLRSPESIGEDLEVLARKHGVKRVYLLGSMFNEPAGHARLVCEEILRRRLTSLKWCALLHPANIEDGLIDLMVRSGLATANIGNESGSDRVLEALGRGYAASDVTRLVKILKTRSVRTQCFLLLGGPQETRATFTESIRQMEDLKPDTVSLTPGIRVYPNTPIERLSRSEGRVNAEDGLLRPRFYLSDATREWIVKETDQLVASHPGWTR